MKNLTHYRYGILVTFHTYLFHGEDVDKLIKSLNQYTQAYRNEIADTSNDKSLWFRIGSKVLVWTIDDIENTLKNKSLKNYELLIDGMKDAIELQPNFELEIYYS